MPNRFFSVLWKSIIVVAVVWGLIVPGVEATARNDSPKAEGSKKARSFSPDEGVLAAFDALEAYIEDLPDQRAFQGQAEELSRQGAQRRGRVPAGQRLRRGQHS